MDRINSPEDLKKLSCEQLKRYAEEVRRYIVETVNNTGGHLASNLGVVELTIALHYVFDSPRDKILWDVGHQSYTHKIITGRRQEFLRLRENGGISGFPLRTESEHDAFTMGHSSTSLSAGLGYVRARDLSGEDYQVVSVVGDGAFTGGMAFEAINDIGASHAKMIIILNDNKMSISKNVGAMANYLARLRLSKRYSRIKYNIKKGAMALPFFGDKIFHVLDKTKDTVKSAFQVNKMFESLGVKYYGPFDGHNLNNLINILRQVRQENKPVIIHLITQKGKGDDAAELNPSKYHGVSPSAKLPPEQAYSSVLSRFLCDSAAAGKNVTAITAAMLDGTGLADFYKAYPNRCFDVGIAEQHAATMAAGMSAGGCKPYFSVYSTFLQRAFDQVLHDVCINDLPVVFAVDRAGAVGADGVTHQGIFDLSYLGLIPNMTICTPKDGNELYKMLVFSLTYPHPLTVRYPKSFRSSYGTDFEIAVGKWEILRRAASRVYVLAAGSRMLEIAVRVKNVTVINACFVKPLDEDLLDELNRPGNVLITMEDNVLHGGFGESVSEYYGSGLKAEWIPFALKNEFLENYDIEDSFRQNGITVEAVEKIAEKYR